MRIATALLLISAACTKTAHAFSSGAGSCGAGNTAVQATHLMNPTTGSLETGGFTVSLGGTPLSSASTAIFPVGEDVELKIDGAKPFKGFLMRLGETGGVQTDKAFSVAGNDIQKASACFDVGGVTHSANSPKESVSATLNLSEPASDMPLDVTVVVSNAGKSEYYYSQFKVTASEDQAAEPEPVETVDTPAPEPLSQVKVTSSPAVAKMGDSPAASSPASATTEPKPVSANVTPAPAAASTKAPTKASTKAPTKASTKAPTGSALLPGSVIATSQLAKDTKVTEPPKGTQAPAISGNTVSTANICEDSLDFRYKVTRDGSTTEHGCYWLSKRRARILVDCVKGSDVMKNCPEACGACQSQCKDDDSVVMDFKTFDDKIKKDGNCEWLKKHIKVWPLNCVVGSEAFKACKNTCNNCGVAS